ncbi:MAG: SUMF1/EgtB/PvdO family nonheme iron enzyme [Acidobacteria bacterium]|nr:SUMF1/EgtB/PvdO family nonheme iron enzyme [Acidobacteriota bacterium]
MKECVSCSRKFPDHMVFCPFDGDMLDGEVEDPLIGRVIDGKYRLEEKLGEGGMGTVYRAKHVLIQNDLAVKILHSALVADRHAVARFQREATAAARIKHPNAVGVTDFGRTEDEIVYIVMELFVGKSLRDIIEEEGALPVERSITIVRQVCLALDAAHRSGIIHRDIKPDNIVLEKNNGQGELVKVLDFGIAKLKDGPSNEIGGRLTRQGVIIGSPHYLSPEQCQNSELDARSDLYSLGIVLYEMFTADVPFKAPTPIAVAMMHTTDKPAPVKEKRPDLPDGIAQIVMRSLEKDPSLRPQTAIELAQELERASLESGVIVPPLPGAGTAYTLPTSSGTNIPIMSPDASLSSPTTSSHKVTPDLKSSLSTLAGNKYATTGSLSPEKSTTETKPPSDRATGRLSLPTTGSIPKIKETPSFIASSSTPTSISNTAPVSLGNTSLVNLMSTGETEVKSKSSKNVYILSSVVVLLVIAVSYFAFFSNPTNTTSPTPLKTSSTSSPGTDIEGMVLIKGGSFKMGYNLSEKDDKTKFVGPEYEATVEDFYIDKTEISNQDYKKFIDATKHPSPPGWKNNQFPAGTDLYPVTDVTLADAEAYAKWASKRLPTEKEWEYAARGSDGRIYPWGKNWQNGVAISAELKEDAPRTVGSLPKGASPFGVLDMAGNVWEWTSDKFSPYPNNKEVVDPKLRDTIVIRGGSFKSNQKVLTTYVRNFVPPDFKGDILGFRCVKSAK